MTLGESALPRERFERLSPNAFTRIKTSAALRCRDREALNFENFGSTASWITAAFHRGHPSVFRLFTRSLGKSVVTTIFFRATPFDSISV